MPSLGGPSGGHRRGAALGRSSRVRGAQLCPSRFSIVGAFFGLTGVASPFRLRDTHSLVTTLAPGYSRSSLSRVASSTLSVTTTCVGDPTTSFAPRLRLDAALAPFCFCCPKPSERPPPPATTFSSICHGALWKNPLFAKTKPSKGRAFEGSIGVRGRRMALLVLEVPKFSQRSFDTIDSPTWQARLFCPRVVLPEATTGYASDATEPK